MTSAFKMYWTKNAYTLIQYPNLWSTSLEMYYTVYIVLRLSLRMTIFSEVLYQELDPRGELCESALKSGQNIVWGNLNSIPILDWSRNLESNYKFRYAVICIENSL